MSAKVISIGDIDYFGRLEVRWTPNEHDDSQETYHYTEDLGISSESIARFKKLTIQSCDLFGSIQSTMKLLHSYKFMEDEPTTTPSPFITGWAKKRGLEHLLGKKLSKDELISGCERRLATYERQYIECINEQEDIRRDWLRYAKRLERRCPLVLAWAMADPAHHANTIVTHPRECTCSSCVEQADFDLEGCPCSLLLLWKVQRRNRSGNGNVS